MVFTNNAEYYGGETYIRFKSPNIDIPVDELEFLIEHELYIASSRSIYAVKYSTAQQQAYLEKVPVQSKSGLPFSKRGYYNIMTGQEVNEYCGTKLCIPHKYKLLYNDEVYKEGFNSWEEAFEEAISHSEKDWNWDFVPYIAH